MKSPLHQHTRHTPRLDGYDDTQSGTYFITICTKACECSFGEIISESMRLNPAGLIVAQDWGKLPHHFGAVKVADYVVMPNHFHGILTLQAQPQTAVSLVTIVGGFKSGITRRINALQDTPGDVIWQRSYHDRIIRDETELRRIQQYIADNPLRWALDDENPTKISQPGSYGKSGSGKPCPLRNTIACSGRVLPGLHQSS